VVAYERFNLSIRPGKGRERGPGRRKRKKA